MNKIPFPKDANPPYLQGQPYDPPPQTPIDEIYAKYLELKGWPQDWAEAKSAIYNLLAAEAVMCPWEWDGKKGLIELVPLSKVKEIFGE